MHIRKRMRTYIPRGAEIARRSGARHAQRNRAARCTMSTSSPSSSRCATKQDIAAVQLSSRLKKCWETSLDLTFLPSKLAEVLFILIIS